MKFSALWNDTVIITALAYGFLCTIAILAPFVGTILALLFWLSLVRYSYQVLICFAQGHDNVPPPDFDTVNPFNRFSLLLHFVAFPAAIAAAQIYLPAPVVFSILIAAVFPASAALMAITGSLEAAFSPTAAGQAIRLVGRDYVLVCVAAILVSVGATLVVRFASVGWLFSLFVSSTAEAWAMLGSFGLIGAAVHAHRLDFDIPGERPDRDARAHADRERDWHTVLDQAYASLRGGRPEAGYRELRKFLEQNAGSPQAHYWLVENLLDWGDKRHAVAVAARLIEAEIEAGRVGRAYELYTRCRRISAEIALPAEVSGELAAYARSIGQEGIASELQAGADAARPAAGGEALGYNPGSSKPT